MITGRGWAILVLFAVALPGCADLQVHDISSILVPRLLRSVIVGIVAGFGTTFAGVPDLIAMLKRRSSVGMNPRMAAITGLFQIGWVYYGLLILSRPVIAWNALGATLNLVTVTAFFYFNRHIATAEECDA
jgi:uncharacterized protein with PQ loop repeat